MDLKALLEWYVNKKSTIDAKVKFNNNYFE
jgi:hypothetical protein